MAFGGMVVENPKLDMDGDQAPQSTFGEGALAALELGYSQTPVKTMAEYFTLGMYEYGKTATPEELNEKYPFMPEHFKEPEDIGKAAELADRVRRRQQLEQTVEEGPKGPLYGLTAFSAQMLPHALDPLNIAAGMGVTAAVAKAGLATRLAAAATTKYGKAAATVGVTAADMFAGNMIGEVAAQSVEEAEQRGGSFQTAVINSAVGAAFGLGLIGAGKGLKWLANKHRGLQEAAISTSAVHVSEGRPPVVDTVLKQVVDETNIKVDSYTYTPLVDRIKDPATGNIVLDAKAGPLYVALDDASGNFVDGKTLPSGQNHMGDDLVYLTDNKNFANSTAASSYRDVPGSIVEVSLEGKRVLDLDNPPNGFQDLSREMLFSNDPDLARSVVAIIKEGGYDGFIYRGQEVAGQAHEPHNAIVLFDKEKIKTHESFAPDETKVKKMTHAEMKKIHGDSQKDLLFTERQQDPKPFDEAQLKALESEDFSHLEKQIDEEIKELELLDTSDVKDKKFLEEIAARKKEIEDDYSIMKKGMGCLLGLISG